uniref:Formin like 3 n=1 Tax=Chrysemys picta bellii TaxID=8478 RepID=A0A8C3I6E5_CHRPI
AGAASNEGRQRLAFRTRTVPLPGGGCGPKGLVMTLHIPASMNLPPDKARLLRQYDNEKKWDLICDQERFQVKNPPHTYIQKLQTFLDPGVTRKKFRRRVQESTKVLRELEISLRTNHIGWVREFLNDENKGLDVLVEYLSFAQCAVMFDFEGLESGEDGALEKLKSWSRSIEDLQHPITLSAPFTNSLARSARQSALRCSTLPSRKALKNSRLVSQKDDVHVCIMCLRAIMNYQYGFNLVMSHPHAVNEIALSLNNKNPRTKALVLELLAAVCLVRGGHEIILAAFDNFKEVCKETHRFEKLMDYFRNEDSNIDFMVACMQFINIVVHSVEDMNFRVHLQYEFTKLGLEEFLQKSRHTESEKLQVQIQAYLDNVFDVGGLLEDAETKNVALEKVEELEEHVSHLAEKLLDLENENVMRVAELEKQLLQREKELELVKVWGRDRAGGTTERFHTLPASLSPAIRIKKPIKTKFRLPIFNWTALKPNQISGTVFSELDDERILEVGAGPGASSRWEGEWSSRSRGAGAPAGLGAAVHWGWLKQSLVGVPSQGPMGIAVSTPGAGPPQGLRSDALSSPRQDLDLEKFEELFKTKAQGPAMELVCAKSKASHKAASKVTLLEANRAKNLAITLRKAGRSAEEICRAIHMFDLQTLPVDFVECLMRFLPTEAEVKLLRQYEKERKPLEELADEDRFMLHFSKVERLAQRMGIMAFLGNFHENLQMLTPVRALAGGWFRVSDPALRVPLQIILALGNYMNSSKRGCVYGFKLQSLDLLLDTKSTDRKLTLLHFIALTVREKYPDLATFWQELHFVEKAAAVSLENVLLDVKELGRGMDLIRRECSIHDNSVLRSFLGANEGRLEKLQKDAKTAEDAYNTVVRYFGESPKTMPPSVFFPVFVRFIRSYKDAEQENEQRKKQEEVLREKMLAQEAKKLEKCPLQRNKWQQQELIAELRRRQAKEHRPVYEGKDGAIEDIITVLKSVPFTARSAKRASRFFCDPAHHDESNC